MHLARMTSTGCVVARSRRYAHSRDVPQYAAFAGIYTLANQKGGGGLGSA